MPARTGATFEGAREEQTRALEGYVTPAVDIFEDDERLTLIADLPGVDESALDVKLERGILTIQARARHEAPGDPVYREFELTGFFRQFQVSDEIDPTRIEAELRNGVLRLHMPKAAKAQPRKIEVRAAA
jgi:HSP20 family molecular chaperone IbpA